MGRRAVITAIVWAAATCSAATAAGAANSGGFTGSFFGTGGSVVSVGIPFGNPGTVESDVNVPVRFSGDVVLTFQRNGVRGTVVWQPPSSGFLSVTAFRSHRGLIYLATLTADSYESTGGSATARVTGGSSPACADAAATGSSFEMPSKGRLITMTLKRAYPSLVETRCAGPITVDYASALASRSVDVKRLQHGYTAIDLASSRTFAAHGFTGMVHSTVQLHLGRPEVTPQTPAPKKPGSTTRLRYVEVDYQAKVVGDVLEKFQGDPRSCALLGSCRTTGSVDLRLDQRTVGAESSAVALARRPIRDLLTALGLRRGGNPKGIPVYGAIPVGAGDARGVVGSCTDSTRVASGGISFTPEHGSLALEFDAGGADSLRNRCAGPFVSSYELATGQARRGALAHRTITLTINRGSSFVDDGYTGKITAHVRVTLIRTKVTSRVIALAVP